MGYPVKEPWQEPQQLLPAMGTGLPCVSVSICPLMGKYQHCAVRHSCKSPTLHLSPTMVTSGELRTCFSPGYPSDQRLQPCMLCCHHECQMSHTLLIPVIAFSRSFTGSLFSSSSCPLKRKKRSTSSNHTLDLGLVVHHMSRTDCKTRIMEWWNVKDNSIIGYPAGKPT